MSHVVLNWTRDMRGFHMKHILEAFYIFEYSIYVLYLGKERDDNSKFTETRTLVVYDSCLI